MIRHQNADAKVLASALMRGIHPLIIFKMADVQGGTPLIRALARTMASAFLMTNHGVAAVAFFLAESTFCVS